MVLPLVADLARIPIRRNRLIEKDTRQLNMLEHVLVRKVDPVFGDMLKGGAMLAIIGCGNSNRSDDGAGPRVISELRAKAMDLGPPETVQLLDAGTDGIAVMFAARGCDALIVIDACRPLGEPGAIYEVPGGELERHYQPAMNLHDFRWDHALHAGRQIYRQDFPTDVTVYLIEAQTLDLGLALSPAVERAALRLASRIADRVRARQFGVSA